MLLELLIVMNCDELKHIIIDTGDHGSDGNSWDNVFPKLRSLTVDNCVQLEYIFEHYIDDHQNLTEIHLQLPALENFHLRNLPSLVAICPKQYHTTLSALKELVSSECPQVAIKSIADFITSHSTRSMDGTIIKVSLFSYIFVVCDIILLFLFMHIFISHSFIAGIEWKHRAFSRHGKNGGKKLQSRKYLLSG